MTGKFNSRWPGTLAPVSTLGLRITSLKSRLRNRFDASGPMPKRRSVRRSVPRPGSATPATEEPWRTRHYPRAADTKRLRREVYFPTRAWHLFCKIPRAMPWAFVFRPVGAEVVAMCRRVGASGGLRFLFRVILLAPTRKIVKPRQVFSTWRKSQFLVRE